VLRLLAAALLAFAGPAVAADPQASCVLVRTGPYAGSGTVVACEAGRSLVVTNRHVVPDRSMAVTVECRGKVYPAVYHAASAGPDLAVLVVEAELPAVEVADAEPPPGVEVRQWGYTWYGQGRLVPKAGRWVGLSRARSRGAVVVLSGLDNHSGDSGAAVFHDGKVVAVTWGVEGHSVSLADLRGFLREKAAALFPRLAGRMAARRAEAAEKAAEKKAAEPKKAEAPKLKPLVTVFTRRDGTCPHCETYAKTLADPKVAEALKGCHLVVVDLAKVANPGVRAVPLTVVSGPGKRPVALPGALSPAARLAAVEAAK
jgi:glutaredoxin